MIHVANAGVLFVCGACVSTAAGRELGQVTDAIGTLHRVATVDARVPDQVDYLSACPWCGDDTTAARHAVAVRLFVSEADEAKRRGIADVALARVVTGRGELVAASADRGGRGKEGVPEGGVPRS